MSSSDVWYWVCRSGTTAVTWLRIARSPLAGSVIRTPVRRLSNPPKKTTPARRTGSVV